MNPLDGFFATILRRKDVQKRLANQFERMTPKYRNIVKWLDEGNRIAILSVYGMTIEQAEEYVKRVDNET